MDHELMKDFLRESFPNPERKGCPDEDVLQALAEDRIAPDDPVLIHIGSCSECYQEYLHLRREIEQAVQVEGSESRRQTPEEGSNVLPFPSTKRELD